MRLSDIVNNGRSRWWFWPAVGAVVLVLILSVAAFRRPNHGSGSAGDIPTYEVQQGPLVISVTEAGTIKAREQVVLKSEVEGQAAILSLIPEGQDVKKGDLLVELDASGLQDQLIDEQIKVQNADASYVAARENLAVVKNQTKSDIEKAQLTLQFAREDLTNYVEGDFPTEIKSSDAKITLSEGELKRAEERLAGSKRLFEKDFITGTELRADELSAEKARLDLELAQANRALLSDFTYKRTMTQLESDVQQAELALERVKLKANADIAQAEAQYKAKESEFRRQQSKLEKLEAQIEKTKIYAPIDGMVVYATTGQGNWRGNTEPLEEGQVVRERQELIHLPTASSVMAEVKVHESSLSKIKVGLPVRVTVEALPGRSFTGRVQSIGLLPDAQSVFLNPDLKVYNTEIYLDGDGSGLRTGMSCRAEIIVEEYPDAVYVPIQAVVRVKGQPTVYVVNGRNSEPRAVELGFDNNRVARIISGLEKGERVLLAPPLASADDEGGGDFTATGDATAPPTEPVRREAAAPPSRPPSESPPGARPAGPPSVDGGGSPGRGPRPDDNASPEERERRREEFRKRMESMSPEEREQMRQQRGSRGDRPERSGDRPRRSEAGDRPE